MSKITIFEKNCKSLNLIGQIRGCRNEPAFYLALKHTISVTIRDTETYFLTKLLMYQKMRLRCINQNIDFSTSFNRNQFRASFRNHCVRNSIFSKYLYFKFQFFYKYFLSENSFLERTV